MQNQVIYTYSMLPLVLMEIQKKRSDKVTLLPEQIQQINRIQNHDFYATAYTRFDFGTLYCCK